jgi:cobaltochelatase CobS
MEKTYEDFAAQELRTAARVLVQEARGTGGIAHIGTKEQLIAFFRERGIMPSEIQEAILGNEEKRQGGNGTPVSASDELPGLTSDQPAVDSSDDSSQQPKAKAENEADELAMLRRIILKDAKPEVNMADVEALLAERIGELRKEIVIGLNAAAEELSRSKVKSLQIISPEGEKRDLGLVHKETEKIIAVSNLGLNVMLVGPAGGGKTTTCEKVAEALGLEFFPMSVGPQTTKSDLFGFIDAGGNYHSTPLRRAFENGGLLLLDEVDAANAGVLTIINAMLANGYCSFPDGVIGRHKGFRCICACNTYGRGADREYVGRNQLDAATLDRFVVIDFDYDEDLERALARNDAWVTTVQNWRRKAQDIRARVVISPRASIHGATLLAAGFKLSDVAEMVVWKGIPSDIRAKIQNG